MLKLDQVPLNYSTVAICQRPLPSKGRLKCGTLTAIDEDVAGVPDLVWWVIVASSSFWGGPLGFELSYALDTATMVELANLVLQSALYSTPLGSSAKPML